MQTVIQTREEWDEAVVHINSADVVAWDWETLKTENWSRREPMGISFAVAPENGRLLKSWYLPVGHKHDPTLFGAELNMPFEWVKEINWQTAEWVAHNAKFDLYQNKRNGLPLPERFRCTQIQAHLLDETRFSYKLADLAHDILHAEKVDLDRAEKMFGWDHIPPLVMGHYACIDAELCYRLNRLHAPLITEQDLEPVFAESMEYVVTLMDVEAAGLPVDWDQAEQAAAWCEAQEQAIRDRLGWNPAQRGLAARILHGPPVEGGLGLPVLKRSPKAPRGPVIDRATLTRLQVRVADQPDVVNMLQDVIDYRNVSKARSTWFEGFVKFKDDNGMIHPGFRQDGTGTGRISSEKPNIQQIPRT